MVVLDLKACRENIRRITVDNFDCRGRSINEKMLVGNKKLYGSETMLRKKPHKDILLKKRYQRDEENRIIVNMTVNDDSNFLSVFSRSDTPVISTEVAEFIENSTNSILPKEQLTLRIHSNCIDDFEKQLYKDGIREYYNEKCIANGRELKRNNIVASLLMLGGILVLAFHLFFEHITSNMIWPEVIYIAAWVFLSEAVDISVFRNRSLRIKKKRYRTYLSMKIEYIGKAENNKK